ncbi:MAG: DUF192 domain-containing protein [Acidobacteria bacterium]|nr:DUF192 domain-containing protein [Acidobacteriota bacterium]
MTHFLAPALEPDGACGLQIERSGAWLVTHLELALDSKTRTRGLLGRDGLAAGHGLVIAPSQGVHTFGMRFPIDIVFVRRDGRVVRCRPHVRPRRLAIWLTAFAVIELAADAIGRTGVQVGDRVLVKAQPQVQMGDLV